MSPALHTALSLLAAGDGEPSKTPFYIAGGLLAGWAVLVSFLGLRQADFPGTPGRARAVMALSAVLVLGAASMAVATSTKKKHKRQAGATPTSRGGSSEASPSSAQGGQKARNGGLPPTAGGGTAGAAQPSGSGGAVTKLAVAADPAGALKFDSTTLTAKAGSVTIAFANRSPVPHNLTVVKGTAGAPVAATRTISSSTDTTTARLAAGSYTYYCSVDSHRQAGMQGTLTVR